MNDQMNLQIVKNQFYEEGDGLQFGKITINEDYCKEWKINQNDFICLAKNGVLIRPTLYRIGGINTPKLGKDEYFMLLKHREAKYSERIMKITIDKEGINRSPKHLESIWCILDKDGNEKVEFSPFESPYLIKDSQIYSINGKYYNIETGEFYGSASSQMATSEFLFLDNPYDENKLKRGVIKINKKDGRWELFPE